MEEDFATLEACREKILSNDYFEIISNSGSKVVSLVTSPEASCIQRINSRFSIIYNRMDLITDPDNTYSFYHLIPKLYSLQDTTSIDASGILRLRNLTQDRFRGRGVLIGCVDTGIDYTHPVFRYIDGSSKIEGIWDQTIQTGTPPKGFLYGSEYRKEQINQALASEDPYSIVPSVDTMGHGTFDAGIAAGFAYPDEDFTGSAPDASLAMVKLKPAKQYLRDYYLIAENAVAYQESDIFTGIQYLLNLSLELDMPLVILLGLGTNSGGHSGNSNLSNYIMTLSERFGVAVVIAAGNEGNRGIHYEGNFLAAPNGSSAAGSRPSPSSSFQTVEIVVAEGERGFCAEFWTQLPDYATISIVSPSGESTPRVPGRLGDFYRHRFLFEDTVVSYYFHLIGGYLGDVLIFMRFENPTPGIWKLRIYPTESISGRYNIWLPNHNFLSPRTRFLKPNPDITLTDTSTTLDAITVSTYNHTDGSLYLYSGRGFARSISIKPDLAAPGVNVYGPFPGNRFGTRTGSSIAAAHVAGAAAILLSWGIVEGNDLSLDSGALKGYLIRGASRSPTLTYPNREWGFGTLNLYQSLEVLRTL